MSLHSFCLCSSPNFPVINDNFFKDLTLNNTSCTSSLLSLNVHFGKCCSVWFITQLSLSKEHRAFQTNGCWWFSWYEAMLHQVHRYLSSLSILVVASPVLKLPLVGNEIKESGSSTTLMSSKSRAEPHFQKKHSLLIFRQGEGFEICHNMKHAAITWIICNREKWWPIQTFFRPSLIIFLSCCSSMSSG